MALPTDRLFPCTFRTNGPVNAVVCIHLAAACVTGSILLLWMLPYAIAPCVPFMVSAVWCGMAFRPGSRNELLDFAHDMERHLGYRCQIPRTRTSEAARLALSVVVLSGMPLVQCLGAGIAYFVLLQGLRRIARAEHVSIRNIMRNDFYTAYNFLSYPDNQYATSAGSAALWFPSKSSGERQWWYLNRLIPFYLAIAECMHSVAPITTLAAVLPLPWLAFLVIQAKSTCDFYATKWLQFPNFATEWDESVYRVRQSTAVVNGHRMADHFFIGWVLRSAEQAWHPLRQINSSEIPQRTPALISDTPGGPHIHLTGPTGVNKTTIGQLVYAIQAIRGKVVPTLDATGNKMTGLDSELLFAQSDPVPMLVIDLKGDLSLFNTVREECQVRGQPFQYFSAAADAASSHFNPITNLHRPDRHLIEFCEVVLNAMDLFHGLFYGGGYYSEQCRDLFLRTLKAAPTVPSTFEEIYELLARTLDRRKHKDVFELLGRLYALSQYPVLGPPPDGVDSIDFPTLYATNGCAFFHLPAMEAAMSVVTIAKLVLFAFLAAATDWNKSGKAVKYGLCMIDELQVIASQTCEKVYQQASGAKVRLITSNQTLANLDSRDAPNLSKTIWGNTNIKQAFALLDKQEREDWINLSGETLGELVGRDVTTGTTVADDGTTSRHSSQRQSFQPVIHTRLNQNTINSVNNTTGASLLYVMRDSGLCTFNSEPCQIWCPFPMTQAEYQRRVTTPWPGRPAVKIDRGVALTTVVNTLSAKQVEQKAMDKYAALEALFGRVSKSSGRRSVSAGG